MKIELAREHTINGTTHPAGTVLDLPLTEATAAAWIKKGIIKPAGKAAAVPAPEKPKA